jgi:hypothetical protein
MKSAQSCVALTVLALGCRAEVITGDFVIEALTCPEKPREQDDHARGYSKTRPLYEY